MQKLIFQDNQVHSTWSDGSCTLEEIFEYNRTHDQLDLTLSDHVDKNTDWFPKYVQHAKKLRQKYPEFNVRIGCEVKILDDGTLNTTPAILKAAEVVLGSVHHFEGIKHIDPQQLMQREFELTKLLAQQGSIDILAHPFSMGHRFHKSSPPKQWVAEVYRLCVKNKIKFEYNYKNAPASVREFVKNLVQKDQLAHLSFGSDMHHDLRELGTSGFKIQDTIPVMVTGTGAGGGQSILKALKLSPLPLRIVAVDASPLAAGVYTGDAAYLVPKRNERGYIERIISLCKKEKIRLLFVGNELELEILSLNRAKIEKESGAKVIVSNVDAIRIADDKWSTVQFLKKHHFPYAESGLAGDVSRFIAAKKFPLIVKPRVGTSAVGVCTVRTPDELTAAVDATSGAIIQEYLSTDEHEFTCSGFFYKGKNYGVLTAQRTLRHGDTYKAHFTSDPKLEAFIAKVGSKLNLFGPCNFQLRKTKKGPVIFEINCRFSGTTGAVSFLGFNGANLLLQILCLKRPPLKLNFKSAYMFRYWNELFTSEKDFDTLSKKGELDAPFAETNVF